jgi:hypothetical protein
MINADEFRRNPFTSLALGDLEKEALVSPDGLVVARRVNDPNEPRDSYVKIYTGLWSGGFESFTQAMLALPELLAENERLNAALDLVLENVEASASSYQERIETISRVVRRALNQETKP